MADRHNRCQIIMVSIVREIQKTKNENKTFVRSKKDKKPKCKKKQKTGYTCKSGKAAIPSGIGRNCRMVALSRHIAGGRLRRFYIHPHIHGYPRAAKALTSNRNIILLRTNCIHIAYKYMPKESLSTSHEN